jgi:uncharacterized transporter YbjL
MQIHTRPKSSRRARAFLLFIRFVGLIAGLELFTQSEWRKYLALSIVIYSVALILFLGSVVSFLRSKELANYPLTTSHQPPATAFQ